MFNSINALLPLSWVSWQHNNSYDFGFCKPLSKIVSQSQLNPMDTFTWLIYRCLLWTWKGINTVTQGSIENQKGVNTFTMFHWEPKGHYHHTKAMIVPFWFSQNILNSINALLPLSWVSWQHNNSYDFGLCKPLSKNVSQLKPMDTLFWLIYRCLLWTCDLLIKIRKLDRYTALLWQKEATHESDISCK